MEIHAIWLSVLLISQLISLCPALSSGDGEGYDYLALVLQWPGSRRESCKPLMGTPPADFGIHGLWPYLKNQTKQPINCDKTDTLKAFQINSNMDRLLTHWPSRECPSRYGFKFWNDEWIKHGTCSKSVLDQHQYFQKALDYTQQLGILSALAAQQIKPDAGKLYATKDISNAIKAVAGQTKPALECSNNNSRLLEVYVCLNQHATGFIDCPMTLPDSKICPPAATNILFPPISPILVSSD